MTLQIDSKRQQLLDCGGHALVLGGPGSGKTTIALKKAIRRINEGLAAGQSVMFLSFSRAAVARISEASKIEAAATDRHLLNVQTFHSFFWDILRSHGYLLGSPKRLRILLPHDERALSGGLAEGAEGWREWLAERSRLFHEEGRIAFDLFAPSTAQLLAQSGHIRRLIAQRFPLVIVDEAQDTDPNAWQCIARISSLVQVVCLADLEQQIFDFLPGVGPERIAEIEATLSPLKIDLGGENNRSPGTEIIEFGNDVLRLRSRSSPYAGVTRRMYNPKQDMSKTIRSTVGMVQRSIRAATGHWAQSLAILLPYGIAAARTSAALSSGAKPMRHKLLFDEAASMLSARFAAFLLEPRELDRSTTLSTSLELLAAIRSASGSKTGGKYLIWAEQLREGRRPKAKLIGDLEHLLDRLQQTPPKGNPSSDWIAVKTALRASTNSEISRVAGHLDYLIAFNRGKRISANLSDMWEREGRYVRARDALESALAEDQILGNLDDPRGLQVMTIHKSKAKQFDGVIIVREGVAEGPRKWRSSFVWRDDAPPYHRSRKILRVAITRSKHHVLILEPPYPDCPIMGQYKL